MKAASTQIALKNLLFATDFSAESAQAIGYARALCHAYQARVHLAHVVDLFPYSLSDTSRAAVNRANLLDQGAAGLRDFALTHRLDSRHFEPVILTGEVFAALEKFVDEHDTDLIILGSRGDTGLKRLFEGSVAEEIFRTAHCPVLVGGPQAREPVADGLFRKILYATDMGPASRSALPYLEFLLDSNPNAQVTLAHFVSKDEATAYATHTRRRQLENEIRGLLPAHHQSRIADALVEAGPATEGMIEAAARIPADLLVLGVRYGGAFFRAAAHGLCSFSCQVIARAECPVLTVRSAAAPAANSNG